MIPSDLSPVLPIFPLRGALLLPGGRLPLHIFELRYRNMVHDALDAKSCIGVIQPMEQDETVLRDELPDEGSEAPPLYDVGCAGAVERSEKLSDGRFIILLKGLCRFRIRTEFPLEKGYRRVEADYAEFLPDARIEESDVATDPLLRALRAFGEHHHIAFELDKLRELSGLTLLNSVAMALPFPPEEKQALLEAEDVEQRFETLLALMKMGIQLREDLQSNAFN